MSKEKIIRIACIGCGARGQMYTALASEMKDKFLVTAAADPVPERVEKVRKNSGNPDFKSFHSAGELLNSPKLADVLIIATQDGMHYGNCIKGIDAGYDILLEKPVATNLEDIFSLERYASEKKSRIMVCYVLRFSPFYKKVKEIISGGLLGDIINMNYTLGITPWRMAHSFVRGHWAEAGESTPTIVAKACHDTDIIQWLAGRECVSVASTGALNHFRKENAPEGAPERCTDGCPVEKDCIYNAYRYAGDKKYPWLPQIFDKSESANEEEIISWLKESGWGRCVYRCSNDALDHQSVLMNFEENISCTFTMTAFEQGRHLEIYGTKGVLKGGETYRNNFNAEILLIPHEGKTEIFNVTENIDSVELRYNRDRRLIERLYDEMTRPANAKIESSLADSIHGHLIAFAAEKSRTEKKIIPLNELRNNSL